MCFIPLRPVYISAGQSGREKPPILQKAGPAVLQLRFLSGRPERIWEKGTYFARFSLMAACAAARRAMGTRKGEQDT